VSGGEAGAEGERGPLVLIVEDNEKNLKLARDLLGVTGFRTLEAETAKEGLVLARRHCPDLVLMDVRLSGMGGVAALAALRADPATAGLTVVALAAQLPEAAPPAGSPGFRLAVPQPIVPARVPGPQRAPADHDGRVALAAAARAAGAAAPAPRAAVGRADGWG
jgi:two-component system cell cycle response regulator DivK